MTLLYPDTCGDYYPKTWDLTSYQKQLQVILNRQGGECLAVANHEFTSVSVIRKIFEAVKGVFGFTDSTDKVLVNSALLKFLCKGEELGYINADVLQQLNDRKVSYPSYLTDTFVQRLIGLISIRHLSREPQEVGRQLQTMHATLIEYHQENGLLLRPGFWSRLIQRPCLNPAGLVDFGDSHLEMSKQVLTTKQPSYSIALDHLLRAHEVHNTSPQFQQKLWIHWKAFLDQYKMTQTAIAQQSTIQNVILSIASISLKNNEKEKAVGYLNYLLENYPGNDSLRARVGECYLKYDCYENVYPFLPLLQQQNAHNAEMQEKIGNIFWKQEKFLEAVGAYKTTIELYKKEIQKESGWAIKIAEISGKIGKFYLDKKEKGNEKDVLAFAFEFYAQAVQFHQDQIEYKEGLCRTYIQFWKEKLNQFEALYGENFFHFIPTCNFKVCQDHAIAIKQILFSCSENALINNKPPKLVSDYLMMGEALYHKDPDYICEIIQKFLDIKLLNEMDHSKLDSWIKNFPKHSLLKEKAGDVYWEKGDKKKAIRYYQEAISLYENQKNAVTKDSDLAYYQKKLSHLNGRIGDQQITLLSFDQGIGYLKQAVIHDSEKRQGLFKAYVQAGDAEENNSLFTYNKLKHIDYYMKAFDSLPQNGKYLQKLFELLFKNGQNKEITDLFLKIQKYNWASEVVLKGEVVLKVVAQLRALDAKAHSDLILSLLEKTNSQEPTHVKIKDELYRHRFTFACENIQSAVNEGDDSQKIAQLEKAIEIVNKNIQGGFDKVTKLQAPQEKQLAQWHARIAEIYIGQILFEVDPNSIKARMAHYEQFVQNITTALARYDKAIELDKSNASLHFDKAFVLDEFAIEPDEAIKEYLLAVRFNNKNPFYNKCLAVAYSGYKSDAANKAKYEANIPLDQESEFGNIYRQWKNNVRLKVKEAPIINPHRYEIETSWLGSTQLKVKAL